MTSTLFKCMPNEKQNFARYAEFVSTVYKDCNIRMPIWLELCPSLLLFGFFSVHGGGAQEEEPKEENETD